MEDNSASTFKTRPLLLSLIVANALLFGCGEIRLTLSPKAQVPVAAACTAGSIILSTPGQGAVITPVGCTKIIAEAWAGGSGGTAAASIDAFISSPGSGGASGGYAKAKWASSEGALIQYTVGAGGSSGNGGGSTQIGPIATTGGSGKFWGYGHWRGYQYARRTHHIVPGRRLLLLQRRRITRC